jgi:hypothetical protein
MSSEPSSLEDHSALLFQSQAFGLGNVQELYLNTKELQRFINHRFLRHLPPAGITKITWSMDYQLIATKRKG